MAGALPSSLRTTIVSLPIADSPARWRDAGDDAGRGASAKAAERRSRNEDGQE